MPQPSPSLATTTTFGATAMSLTTAQLQTLKSDILADPVLSTLPFTQGDNSTIADAYNATASPDFWVWRTSVPSSEYRGINGIVWTEVDSLTVSKARIFEWLTVGLTAPINASDTNVRAGIQNAFGTSSTLTNLTTMGRRLARRIEKLLANGTGTTAVPATMGFEGTINYIDVFNARSL